MHLVPLHNHMLHVLVGWEEAHHAIGDDAAKLPEKFTIVAHHASVFSLIELGAYS